MGRIAHHCFAPDHSAERLEWEQAPSDRTGGRQEACSADPSGVSNVPAIIAVVVVLHGGVVLTPAIVVVEIVFAIIFIIVSVRHVIVFHVVIRIVLLVFVKIIVVAIIVVAVGVLSATAVVGIG
ncbi:MAG: hypothetical protein ACO1NQ_02435 [Flavobacteriales bacterium]